jgi:microcystin-dependent protein
MPGARSTGLLLTMALIAGAPTARAQECLIGEIRMFAGTFAPRGWALLDGQLLPISQNTALFSILGTTYGGDGRTTFALPDLRGRAAVHAGAGPGLSPRPVGSGFGTEVTTLTPDQMPAHTHEAQTETRLSAASERARRAKADGGVLGRANGARIYSNKPADVIMADSAATSATRIAPAGGGQSVALSQPSLAINHIICLFGIYPSRN